MKTDLFKQNSGGSIDDYLNWNLIKRIEARNARWAQWEE